MKKSYIKYLLVNCVVLFLFPNFIFAQKTKNVDKYRDSIDKNIFRVVTTKYAPNNLIAVGIQYERQIKKSFTFLLETGPTMDIQKFGDINDPSKSKYQFSFSVFGSAESRYYFNLAHRIKKEKPVHNFSAFYVSLQEYVLSNPFIFINQKASTSYQGNVQTFLNVGWQKQFQSHYLHVFAGTALYRKTLSKYYPDQFIQGWQKGVSLGGVL